MSSLPISRAYNAAHPDETAKRYQSINAEPTKQFHYYADRIVYFAWFADFSFVINAYAWHYNKPNTQWRNSIAYVSLTQYFALLKKSGKLSS